MNNCQLQNDLNNSMRHEIDPSVKRRNLEMEIGVKEYQIEAVCQKDYDCDESNLFEFVEESAFRRQMFEK